MSNFITNEKEKSLSERLISLISVSEQIRALVGFCYFSGFMPLYDALRNNNNLSFKLLIGLNIKVVDNILIEVEHNYKDNTNKQVDNFISNLIEHFKLPDADRKDVYNNAKLLIELINQGRLQIRKTKKPNHSKIYLFDFDQSQKSAQRTFITGSSNLTRSGLGSQEEFNVEIKDYGYNEASNYFEERWKDAIPITEKTEYKEKFLKALQEQTYLREITPFEAYCYILKSYLDSFEQGDTKFELEKLFRDKDYTPFKFQLDAIKQAVAILKMHNGVLLADVVGLGKSVMAAAVARLTGRRGIVLCPPGLVGDQAKTTGWRSYLKDFGLNDWEVYSIGKLDAVISAIEGDNIEVVIIDEIHRFRNEHTISYEQLKRICNGKKVIALTATPFNNKPLDLLSILKLFINPRKSTITLDENLGYIFTKINTEFNKLHYIKKYLHSKDRNKREKAEKYSIEIFAEKNVSDKILNERTKKLANQVRQIIEPVTIRRNRKDLLVHPEYSKEISNLSIVRDPETAFFELTFDQSLFYDNVIRYFQKPEAGGKFTGAVYRPIFYAKNIQLDLDEIDDIDDEKLDPDAVTQTNLYFLIQRLLVLRFESSFGAFKKSIERFLNLYITILRFIEKTNKYLFSIDTIEKILELMDEQNDDKTPAEIDAEINQIIINYENKSKDKRHRVYDLNDNFARKHDFIKDINNDISLFQYIREYIDKLNLFDDDPKSKELFRFIQNKFAENPNRKILVFTQFADTVEFLKANLEKFDQNLFKRTLFVYGNLGVNLKNDIITNFDASYKQQNNDYDLIITTDKLSEGYNLNRAGIVVNYDIPWNPVRVIQRIGRINRIGKKVFDELLIYNFFPTEQGKQHADAKTTAANKMFMIHNILGEDVKIFDPDEEPTPSRLFEIINQNPEDVVEESLYTKIYREFELIKQQHPDILERIHSFPSRAKVVKSAQSNDLTVVYKRNRLFVQHFDLENQNLEPKELLFDEIIDKIRATPNDKPLIIDDYFWDKYEEAIKYYNQIPLGQLLSRDGQQALKNLKFISHKFQSLPDDLNSFVTDLLDDIENIGSLTSYTISDLAKLDISNIDKLIAQLRSIRERLGEDYFASIKSQLSQTDDKQIIISIMNKQE